MKTTFPDDLDVERLLVPVRTSVMDATQHVRSPRHSTRYRATRTVLIGGAAVAILTAGAIVAVVERQSVIDHTAHCYEHARVDSGYVTTQGRAASSDKLDPIDACGIVWSVDGFNLDSDQSGRRYPDLVACTGSDGIAAVFPREARLPTTQASARRSASRIGVLTRGSRTLPRRGEISVWQKKRRCPPQSIRE